MRARALLVLLTTALCTEPTLAAVRWEILNRDIASPGSFNGSMIVTSSNPSTQIVQDTVSETPSSAGSPGSSPPNDPSPTSPTGNDTTVSSSSEPHPPISWLPIPEGTSSSRSLDTTWETAKPTSTCDRNATTCVTTSTLSISVPTQTTSTSQTCIPPPGNLTQKTTISITYTATTTFYGNPTDYTPPYPELTTTPYCNETSAEPDKPPPTLPVITKTNSEFPYPLPSLPTVTFVTTDKNPSVIFSPGPIPDYSATNDSPFNDPGHHESALPSDEPGNEAATRDSPRPSPKPTFTVTAGPDYVVIGDSTFDGIKPGQTSTVVAGGGTFTIFPTAVIGEGVTVDKPAPAEPTTNLVPGPTKTNVGGLPISVSGSVVEIDGRTLTIPPEGTTTVINGESVSLGPGKAVVGESLETFAWSDTPAEPTDVLVAGGDMLTAIGPTILVLHSTTITYGPGIEKSLTTVDDDTITIGPSGIVVHDSTLGGLSAEASDTTYEVVGGITITQLGKSVIVVNGHTYTISRGTDRFTTSVGDELVTIGPEGVIFNSMTFGTEDVAAIVTTFEPEGSWTSGLPAETGSSDAAEDEGSGDTGAAEDEDEDDMAGAVRPDVLLMGLCVALGLWGLA